MIVRLRPIWLASIVALLAHLCSSALALAATPTLPAPVAPAAPPIVRLDVETGRYKDPQRKSLELSGRTAVQQLLVTGYDAQQKATDLTRAARYETAPQGIVEVSAEGVIRSLADGKTTLKVFGPDKTEATLPIEVVQYSHEPAISFANQVVPVFTKLGCNSGGCHGKASGQNGFRLSLMGFEPADDYEHLVKEGRGRRVFPAAPARSLLLVKPTGAVPHGGGVRLEKESASYKLIEGWIRQGMPYGSAAEPKLAKIEMFPAERTLGRNARQQLLCIAHYTDGRTEDVTAMTVFEPNDKELARVGKNSIVETLDRAGNVAVMARYQGQVAVCRLMVPLGAPVNNLPPAKNFVDELVFAQLKKLGMPPSPLCDDPTFLRRATLDIAGRMPSVEEAEQFLADKNPNKREAAVDRLLASDDYASFFANKWGAVLKNRRDNDARNSRGVYAFHSWIYDSLLQNKPYDEFVRDIVAATGDSADSPPVVWYRGVREANQQVEDVAQLFLGMRLQCARCHHHPFEKWSQNDYYSFSAFFSTVKRKRGVDMGDERIYHTPMVAQTAHIRTGAMLKPAGLDGPVLNIAPEKDPRQYLADWMASPENKFFAPALVNRYWKHFFARGLVDPEDDMRATNPAANPELLAAVSKQFVEHKFDLRWLVRTICTSNVYQLNSEPNEFNNLDRQNFSRYYPRRLNAEVLLDSIDSLTGTRTHFPGQPQDTRAMQLADNSVDEAFLKVFGKPGGASSCECERVGDANLTQCLHLLNSADVQQKLESATGRAATLAALPNKDHKAWIRGLYLQAFARPPSDAELAVAVAHFDKTKNDRKAIEDIIWALINTKEFLFNH